MLLGLVLTEFKEFIGMGKATQFFLQTYTFDSLRILAKDSSQ